MTRNWPPPDIPIFPCKNIPGDKEQHKAPHTARGFKDATTDYIQISRWFDNQWPNALIGVPAGTHFVVVDVDLQHDDARCWLEANKHRIPLTRIHRTQSGGLHFLFQPHDGVGCTVSKIAPHVDTRGRGGYIIWWPAEGHEVLRRNVLAPVPDWIIEALNPPRAARDGGPIIINTSAHARAKLGGIVRKIAAAPEGQRNAITFWGACRMAEMVAVGALARDAAIRLIVEAASRCGLPAWEAQKTAESGLDNDNRQGRRG